MLYNLICGCSFALALVLHLLFGKIKREELLFRILSALLFAYKCAHYIAENVKGNFSVPVEISSISYFFVPVVLSFRIRKLYGTASFFGIAAGLGYFAFYTLFGFTVAESFTLKDILVGCFSHGYLLLAGLYLFKNNLFGENERLHIWIALFAMLSWALVFYDTEMRGITFIYFIIKPQFLFVFPNMSLNLLFAVIYYAVLAAAFAFAVKIFFRLNGKRAAAQ